MPSILTTKDYNQFKLYVYNRNVEKFNWLENLMRQYGWIDAYPMHVYHNQEKELVIKDGHHRFDVARKIGIPAKYAICRDHASIRELQRATNKWSMRDYLVSMAKSGNPNYQKVKEYHERTGIPLAQCISMLSGESAGSNNHNEVFKDGEFIIREEIHAEIIAQIVDHLKEIGFEFATNSRLVNALSKILRVEELSVSELKHKMAQHSHLIARQASVKDYIEMLERVYNRQRKEKIPLSFMADCAAKARNPIARKMLKKYEK